MMEFTVGQIRATECIEEGWRLVKDEYWLFFAMTLVALLIAGAVPLMILLGPMYCGVYYAMLRKMDTGRTEFGDVFKGFDHFGQALIVSGIMIIPTIIGLVFLYASMIAAFVGTEMVPGSSRDNVLGIAVLAVVFEALVISLVISCLHAFVTFAFPLIVDRGLGGFDAFKLSARAVWANLGSVISLLLLQFVLAFLGLLLCFVGIYLVFPVMFAAVAVAHRRLFPKAPFQPMGYSG